MGKAGGINKTKRRRKTAFWRWAVLGLIWATLSTCFYVQALEPSDDAAAKSEQASAYLSEAWEAYNDKDYATALAKCGASLALEETKAAQDLMEKCRAALEKSSASPTKKTSKSAADDWTKTHAAGTRKSVKIDGITYNFRYCPSGTFTMGSPENEEGRGGREGEFKGALLERQHRVKLTKFWMLETEVTVGMWRSFIKATNYRQGSGRMGMGMYGVTEDGTMLLDPRYTWENPGYPQTELHPVVGVDWSGAVAFCEWLAKETGLPVRLPTEAEWEYACRAGTTTAYSFGSDAKYITQYANVYDSQTSAPPGYDEVSALAEAKRGNLSADGYQVPAPVKRFKPNAWNLYDMHGNVTEWCYDLFEMYDSDEQVDPVDALGLMEGFRVLRGGAWNKLPADCRSAMRFYGLPENKSVSNGFRVVIAGEFKTSATPAQVAIEQIEQAAKAGDVDALNAAFRLHDGKNPEKAFAALEKFATRPDCPDPNAKFALAVAYAYGYGVEQDAKKAFALFKEQEKEHQPAGPLHEALLLALALCYERGFGVAEDVSKTIELYEKGLALNYPTATANYGWCCGVGRGVAKNPAETLRYYRRASDLGETGAMCNLGSCYENGANGLPRDAKKAFELYKKAADAGAPRGMSEVARCYETGVGVERSATEVAKWRERAGNAGAFFIEPIPTRENMAPPLGLRLSDLGLFLGRRVP